MNEQQLRRLMSRADAVMALLDEARHALMSNDTQELPRIGENIDFLLEYIEDGHCHVTGESDPSLQDPGVVGTFR